MKDFQFDYGQPLALVALLLVLSTAFAFLEEPPASSATSKSGPAPKEHLAVVKPLTPQKTSVQTREVSEEAGGLARP